MFNDKVVFNNDVFGNRLYLFSIRHTTVRHKTCIVFSISIVFSLWSGLSGTLSPQGVSIGETVCKERRRGFDFFFHFVIFAPYFYGIE